MNKFVAVASSAAFVVMSTLASMAPAEAAPGFSRQQQFVMNWCRSHPRDNDCRDFGRRHNNWSSAQYSSWYQRHRRDRGFDPGAGGIFGFAAGAILGGAAAAAAANSHNNNGHRH